MGARREDLRREAGSLMHFVSAGAAQALVRAIAARAGVPVEGSFGAVGAMLAALRSGEACDVVILTRTQIDELVDARQALGDTATDVGSVSTAIAVRAADPPPDVSGEAPLRAALLAADAVFFPDPLTATAGIHFAKVLDQLGIRGEIATRLKTFPNGATAMRAMAESHGHPIGCTQATEILATPGARLVAALPRGFDLRTVYTAAVNARARDPDAARRLVAAIGDASSRALAAGMGFDPAPPRAPR